jgi:hypothetical protein
MFPLPVDGEGVGTVHGLADFARAGFRDSPDGLTAAEPSSAVTKFLISRPIAW